MINKVNAGKNENNLIYNEDELKINLESSLQVISLRDSWADIRKFLEDRFRKVHINKEIVKRIIIASEEIYMNISDYAYTDKKGEVEIRFKYNNDCRKISVEFLDSGIEFDPTKRENPDYANPLISNNIGGRGILIARNMCDIMKYSRTDGKNILTIIKYIK